MMYESGRERAPWRCRSPVRGTPVRQEPRSVTQPFDAVPSRPQPLQETMAEAGGFDPLDEAVRLHDLAVSLRAEGRLREAAPLCRQALDVFESEARPNHPDIANILNELAGIYADQGDYAKAER